jgi:hypothetical protein
LRELLKDTGPCKSTKTVLFDLEPGVIDALRASPLGELSRPDNLVNQNAGAGTNWAKNHCTKPGHEYCQKKRGRGQKLGQGPLHKGSAPIILNPPVV